MQKLNQLEQKPHVIDVQYEKGINEYENFPAYKAGNRIMKLIH